MEKFSAIADQLDIDRLKEIIKKNFDLDELEKAISQLTQEKLQELVDSMPEESSKQAELQRILEKRKGDGTTGTASAVNNIETEGTQSAIPFDEKPWQEINKLKSNMNLYPVFDAIKNTPMAHLCKIPRHLDMRFLRPLCDNCEKEYVLISLQVFPGTSGKSSQLG